MADPDLGMCDVHTQPTMRPHPRLTTCRNWVAEPDRLPPLPYRSPANTHPDRTMLIELAGTGGSHSGVHDEAGAANVPRRPETLLTEAEHQLVQALGECFNQYCAVVGHGPTRNHDINEATVHVHALQHAVMAQAAARQSPHLYRLLGGVVGAVATGGWCSCDPPRQQAQTVDGEARCPACGLVRHSVMAP